MIAAAHLSCNAHARLSDAPCKPKSIGPAEALDHAQTYTTYHRLWHAIRGTYGQDRVERLTVLADFLEDIGDMNLAARFRGFAKYPPCAHMPYTPWPLFVP